MGSDNKYLVFQAPVLVLLHVPPLVEIAAVCPGEVGGVIDDCRPLALEELIQFQVGLRIYRVAEQLGEEGTEQRFSVNLDVVFLKVPADVPEGGPGLGVHFKHQAYMVGSCRVGHNHFCADALNRGRLQPETVGGLAAHVEAFQAPGIVGVRDALLDGLPFQLGEHNADVQHGPPHWGGGVELFRGGNKLHVVLLEQLHHVRKIQNGAADPVQLVDDYPPHLPFTDLVKQSLELGPVGVLPRIALVLENLAAAAFQLVLAEVNLALNTDTVLAVNGLSGINIIFSNVHCRLLSYGNGATNLTSILYH